MLHADLSPLELYNSTDSAIVSLDTRTAGQCLTTDTVTNMSLVRVASCDRTTIRQQWWIKPHSHVANAISGDTFHIQLYGLCVVSAWLNKLITP